MGLGGFLAAKSELDHYKSEKKREEREVVECPDEEEEECFEVLAEFGITREVRIPLLISFPFSYIALVRGLSPVTHASPISFKCSG